MFFSCGMHGLDPCPNNTMHANREYIDWERIRYYGLQGYFVELGDWLKTKMYMSLQGSLSIITTQT